MWTDQVSKPGTSGSPMPFYSGCVNEVTDRQMENETPTLHPVNQVPQKELHITTNFVCVSSEEFQLFA